MRKVLTTPLTPRRALIAIYDALNGHHWDADTLDRVAEVLRRAGFEVSAPDDTICPRCKEKYSEHDLRCNE